MFSSKTFTSGNLGDNFSFPKHKEFFNDKFYGEENPKSPYSKNAANPNTLSEDYVDPNNPFVQHNPYVPGGILASYKKRMGLSANEVMEQDYWNKVRDLTDEASDYFDVVGKSDRDLMNNTKNYTTRLRLNRDIKFTDDFRKRFMTREYGNYEKYEEGRNTVSVDTEKGENDLGGDNFMKNHRDMMMRLKTEDGQETRDQEAEDVKDLLTNETYADQTMRERVAAMKMSHDQMQEMIERENEMKLQQTLSMSEIQYNGRLSPKAKEEIYRAYLVGTTIKDLSLKYGILPQRVKAIVFQRHLYWNEVYPKLGETHMRMAYERELLYATDFPFVDYGKDLKLMSEIEKGIQLVKVKGSDIDTNPPEAVKKKVEASLAKMKPKK